MVSINVSDDKMDELVRAGFPTQRPTFADMRARRLAHVEAAESIGRDALRLDRVDDLGEIPDSGRVVFTREGQEKVSFAQVAKDAKKLGFAMSAAYVEKAPGKSARLRIWWERGEEAVPVEPTGAMRFHLDGMLKRAYQHLYAFDNRDTDGSFTFNASHTMDENARRGVRDLRIGEGRMACLLREDA